MALNPSLCFNCQFFGCSSCSSSHDSLPMPLPSLLQRLPPCHFYWLNALSLQHSFCVIHFDSHATAASTIHPLWSSLARMRHCPLCREKSDMLFFVLVLADWAGEETTLLEGVLPKGRVIVIREGNEASALMMSI